MQLALYAPGLGYYAAGARKFGADGDFTTAPEMTPLFARALAAPVAAILAASSARDLVEFGAGTGASRRSCSRPSPRTTRCRHATGSSTSAPNSRHGSARRSRGSRRRSSRAWNGSTRCRTASTAPS